MGARQVTPTPFGRKLRSELTTRGWGVRTLAREMAGRDNTPQRVESIRRQLKRYLSDTDPVRPTVSSRHFIETALGLETDSLADDDDEESDVATLLFHALENYVQAKVRQAVA